MTPGSATAATRAHAVPVPEFEPLIGGASYDYADAFEIEPPASDDRTAEQFARAALEGAPWPLRLTILVAHRYLLRLRLGPRSSPQHVLGWKIVTAEPDVIQLEAVSPLLGRGVIVARRPLPTSAVITTYVFFARPTLSRVVWMLARPVHRWAAMYLLEHAVGIR